MEKKKKSLVVIASVLAATAACGSLAFLGGVSNLNKRIDDGVAQTSVSVPGDGGMTATIAGGPPKFAAQVNSTKTCTATISPANVTDKTVLWATSDAAKVAIASATTQSGANQTLTLKSVFNGSVTITATAEANSSAKVTFSVSVYNFVTTMTLVGVGVTDGDDLTTITADTMSNGDIGFATSSSPYQYAGGTALYLDSATSTYSFTAPVAATKHYVFAVFEAKGRDTAIAPDIAAAPSGWAMFAKDSTTKYLYYEFTAASTATTAALTVEDASYSIKEAVYTAPASMAGTGPVVFK